MTFLCAYCDKPLLLVTGREIYPHRKDLYRKKLWLCKPCDAYVGCHGNSDNPLGRVANKQLRYWKSMAHGCFDPVWKNKKYTRAQAYQRLAVRLEIPQSECHIGMFDVEMCKRVVAIFEGKE